MWKAEGLLVENDDEFVSQVEKNIEPRHYFPYVKLQDVDYLKDFSTSPTRKPKETTPNQKAASTKTPKLEPTNALSENQNQRFKCPVCNRIFATNCKYVLGFHIQTQHKEVSKPFMCPNCRSSFVTKNELKSHFLTEHPIEFRIYNRTYSTTGHTNTTPVQRSDPALLTMKCPLCPKKFANQFNVKRHLVTHSDAQPWVCGTCASQYKRREQLQIHLKSNRCQLVLDEQALRHFNCTQCPKAFQRPEFLKLHLRNMHGIQPVVKAKDNRCVFCGYEAKNSRILKTHYRIHTGGNNPYSCPGCGNMMPINCDFYSHISKNCPRNIQPHLDLKSSENGHSIESAVPNASQADATTPKKTNWQKSQGDHHCPYCSLRFNLLCDIIKHKRLMHLKFSCSICDLDFESAKAVSVHKEEVHIIYGMTTNPTKPLLATQPSTSDRPNSGSKTGEKLVKLYRCHICGTKFGIGYELRRHRLKNICESKLARCLECEKCGIFLDNKISLRSHRLQCFKEEELVTLKASKHQKRVYGFSAVKKLPEGKDFFLEPVAPELNKATHIIDPVEDQDIDTSDPYALDCIDPLQVWGYDDDVPKVFGASGDASSSQVERPMFKNAVTDRTFSWVGRVVPSNTDTEPLVLPVPSFINSMEVYDTQF